MALNLLKRRKIINNHLLVLVILLISIVLILYIIALPMSVRAQGKIKNSQLENVELTSMSQLPLNELENNTSLIIDGVVSNQEYIETGQDRPRVVTKSTIHVNEKIKGNFVGNEIIVYSQGGEYYDQSLGKMVTEWVSNEGLIKKGQRYLFFINETEDSRHPVFTEKEKDSNTVVKKNVLSVGIRGLFPIIDEEISGTHISMHEFVDYLKINN